MSIEQPWVEVITVARVNEFHKEAIARFGGPMSFAVDGCLEQCLGNAWTAEQYQEERSLKAGLIFAAYLLFYLANDHCYTDGNKRVAWMSLVYILRHYDLTVDVSDDDAVSFMNDVASGRVNARAVSDWIADRLDVTGPSLS